VASQSAWSPDSHTGATSLAASPIPARFADGHELLSSRSATFCVRIHALRFN